MPRTIHRTPRHLDDPAKLGPLTLAQWVVLVLALALVWPVFTYATFLPAKTRIVIGAVVVGLAIGFTGTGGARSMLDLPRRAWHSLTTPSEHLPGPPRRGPLHFATYDDEPHEEDPTDA